MNNRVKEFFLLQFSSVIYWVLAFIFFTTIRYNGLEEELKIFTDDVLYLPIRAYFEFAILVGAIMGFVYAIIEFLFDIYISKKLILGATILIKSIIYFVLIVILLSSISFLIEDSIDIDLPNERGWWREDPFFWNTVIFFIISSVVFSLIRIANDKFGRGVFLNMLLGKYKKPKEEKRVLMFLDLKDSTKIAEHLGHEKYSRFIQDCFKDLNNLLRKYEAEVYQYVGDEAVINWTEKRGFKNNNCTKLFFAFQKSLLEKSQYYQSEYEHTPVFKAGVHFGTIMIAEVGTVKKELAFHGDVINSASRIQGLCKNYNASLIISKTVLAKLNSNLINYEEIDEDVTLKGKQKKLKVYIINA
ncbi:adenylate/guanylate cyclase domain-containing protein [uncultured Psychroserpens sp.]|uniref:adenylate/guanylate cyclase domain-containing protein n=1 Tax=uncultured Psychroserpens sp. TaxID=255436 RepID=UPI0026066E29|nr:adenylate/guanylate cyclase domain-containing protein [uncultured Psychroserpens sp.]